MTMEMEKNNKAISCSQVKNANHANYVDDLIIT